MHRVIFLTLISFLLFSKKSYLHIIRLPECMFHGNFSMKYKNGYLDAGEANIITRKSVGTITKDCMLYCVTTNGCKSVNHDTNSQDENCYLLKVNDGYSFAQVNGWNNYMTDESDSKNIGPTCESLRPCGQHEICNEQCNDPFYTCTPATTVTKLTTLTTTTPTTSLTTIATTSITDTYENIALGKRIEMSSVADGAQETYCNDGDINTICYTRHSDSSPTVHILLGDKFKVYHVTIRARDENSLSNVNGLNMYVGNEEDTATENELFGTMQQTVANETYSTANGEAKLGRHFFIQNINYSKRLAIREIEVYGVKA